MDRQKERSTPFVFWLLLAVILMWIAFKADNLIGGVLGGLVSGAAFGAVWGPLGMVVWGGANVDELRALIPTFGTAGALGGAIAGGIGGNLGYEIVTVIGSEKQEDFFLPTMLAAVGAGILVHFVFKKHVLLALARVFGQLLVLATFIAICFLSVKMIQVGGAPLRLVGALVTGGIIAVGIFQVQGAGVVPVALGGIVAAGICGVLGKVDVIVEAAIGGGLIGLVVFWIFTGIRKLTRM